MTPKLLLAITVASSLLLFAPAAVADKRLDRELVKEALNGDVVAVKAILDRGADPNAKDDRGVLALNAAAANGNATVVIELIRRGADVNSRDKKGLTPLMAACFYGHKDVVRILLERGANADIKNKWGHTAGMIAYRRGYSEIADLLGMREKMRAIVVLASIKLVIIAVILAWIARKNMDRPLEKSFFHNQKWTLSDAYKILIPLLALNYALVLVDTAPMRPTQRLIIDLLIFILLYGLYWRFIEKKHDVTWSTFGLDNASLNKSGLIHFNVASVLVLSVFGIPRVFGWYHSSTQVPVSPGLDAILSVSIVVLIGPILEELLFRGVLYAPVAGRVGSRAAIGLLTMVNSLAHLQYTQETLAVAVVSFLLYCLYVRSLSLFGPIIWHITCNLVIGLVYHHSFCALEPYLLLGLLVILIVVDSVWLLGRSSDNTVSNTETRFRA
ncbi:MAG: ankyrin repeat domain-containing protein [Desulfomonilaceae bacterium]